MSHGDIASVWLLLSGRQDIGNVLREVIGDYALSISLARHDNAKLRDIFISHIATLRIILDLQRVYLQSSSRTKETESSLLPPDLLFSAVLHLLDTIISGSTSCSDPLVEKSYNRLTIQTTFAGLRTLLLHKSSLSARELELLGNRLEEILERGHWHGAEHALALRLSRQAIKIMAKPTSDGKHTEPACGEASLPDFFSGLYQFQGCEKSMLGAARKVSPISLQSTDWFCQHLVLYDLFWSTTAALIQLCLGRRQVSEAGHESAYEENFQGLSDLWLILSTRYQLRKLACASVGELEDNRATAFMDLVLQAMCAACAEERCECFAPDSNIIQEVRLQHSMHALPPGPDFSSAGPLDVVVGKSVQQFEKFMTGRSTSANLPQNMLTFPILRQQDPKSAPTDHSLPPNTDRALNTPRNPALGSENAPSQVRPFLPSPVSTQLVSRYNQTPTAAQREQARGKSTSVKADTVVPERHPSDRSSYTNNSNPTTTSEVFSHKSPALSSVDEASHPSPWIADPDDLPEVHHPNQGYPFPSSKIPAVTVENFPEAYHPESAKGTPDWERAQTWQPDLNNHLEVVSSYPPTVIAPSIISQESEGNSLQFCADTTQSKPKRWQGFFGTSRTNSISLPPSFTFFASGHSLLLWNDAGAGCYDLHDAESLQYRRINASKVLHGAGGNQLCAVVVKGVSEYRLEVYEGACDVPLRHWKLESLPYALAVSRNDNLIAAKFTRVVKIFQVDTGDIVRHDLPPSNSRSGRGNQLVTFSIDSLSFVATTRYEPEKVVTYWSECSSVSNATAVESTAPTGFPGDNGLSSLLCSSSQTRAAFLATFTEKAPPTFLSLKAQKIFSRPIRDSKGSVGTRIHSAALSPSGKTLVLLNQRNQLFWVDDCWTGTQEPRKVGAVKRSVGVLKEVEMGMPNSEEVHLFWLEKGKGILVTMGKSGGKTKPIELAVDMSMN